MTYQDFDGASSRSSKFATLMKNLEEYVTLYATKDYRIKAEDVPKIITDNFQRSIKASMQYHEEMARVNEKSQDMANAIFHKIMAQTYKSFLK